MFTNYLKTGLRNILKHKAFSFIKIFGLALAMSAGMLIMLMFAEHKSYDRFHKNKEQIYRVLSDRDNSKFPSATTPFALAEALANYPIIRQTSRLTLGAGSELMYERQTFAMQAYFADPAFFKIFSFPLIEGNADQALGAPNSIVVTSSFARKLFGKDAPVGKTIDIRNTVNDSTVSWGSFMITGILDDESYKSHLKFDALVSASSMPALSKENKIGDLNNDWQYNRSYTYVMLNPGKSQHDLAASLADVIHHRNEELKEIKGFELIPERLTDITPGRLVSNETRQTLPLVAYYFLAALALIILASACLNYTSLSTARALTRAKEIGVRKVTGAFRKDLVYQFLGEAILTAVFALGLAMLMLAFLKAAFLQLSMNRYLQFSLESNFGIYIAFVLFAVCTGLAAGFYPALYLSGFRPVKAFRNTEGLASGKPTMRRTLAVCQFVISLFFITTSLLLFNQLRHFMQFDYGFNPDHIVNVSLQGNSYRRVAHEFSSLPGVSSISACNYLPSTGTDNGMHVRRAGTDMEFQRVIIMSTDEKFVSNLGVRLVAGKHLEPTDSISHTILVNQAAVKAIGYRLPADIIGQMVEVEGSREQLEVVGVVEDFFVRMPTGEDKVSPLVLRNQPSEFKYANVKIASADPMAEVQNLQRVWQRIDPYHPFQYRFYDEQLASINQGLFDIISITGFIAFLSVSIACLGLLGMVAYSSERKKKEVGIRKVLGAGNVGIAVLLSKDFLKILLVAILIGAPLSFFVNNLWLQKFPNRVSFGLPTILLSTAILLILGLLTVASQTLAASHRNPVDVLKND